jgi:hypothetical protein
MPRTSLSPLEIVMRQTKVDAELEGLPQVRACLLSRARGLQRQDLSPDDMDVAVGLILCRRALLTAIPGGRLGTPEGMNLVVRILEQVHKGRSALRRARRHGAPMLMPRKQPPVRQVDEDDEAGTEAGEEGTDAA